MSGAPSYNTDKGEVIGTPAEELAEDPWTRQA